MLLFVVVTLLSLGIIVIESAHKHTLQNIAVLVAVVLLVLLCFLFAQ
jgi:hypothetical protein